MNIYDISEKAGVSIATVSRVLNNNPHVSDATRRKVLRIINQSSYVPNAFARGLGLGSMHTIGLLSPDISDPYQSTAVSCLEEAFRRRDYSCLLSCSGRTADAMTGSIDAMRSQKVDAMVLMGSDFGTLGTRGDALLREIADAMPIAMLNAESDCEQVYSIGCDDRRATREATQHLIDSGCKRILYLYHSENRAGQNKLAGYRDALAWNELPIDDRLMCLSGTDDLDRLQALLEGLWQSGASFDAVMTSEDMLAVAAVKFCRRHGLRIPEDVSIVGYNNLQICRYSEPEISSVDNHLPWLCEMIAETVLSALEGREVQRRQIKPGTLAERASTRKSDASAPRG